MSPSGTPLLWGTIGFIAVFLAVAGATLYTGRQGMHKYGTMSVPLIATAFVCMWLMWFCAWLMQWHPLIVPEPNDE